MCLSSCQSCCGSTRLRHVGPQHFHNTTMLWRHFIINKRTDTKTGINLLNRRRLNVLLLIAFLIFHSHSIFFSSSLFTASTLPFESKYFSVAGKAMKTLHSFPSSFFWRCFLKGTRAFRRSWVSFEKSTPNPIKFPSNELCLSLAAAFAKIFILSGYLTKATWIGPGLFLLSFNCFGARWARPILTKDFLLIGWAKLS